MNNYSHLPSVGDDPLVRVDLPCDTGEGPLWDERTDTLTWNNIPAGTLYRFDPASGSNATIFQHTSAIGGHTLQEDGSLAVFAADGEILIVRDGVGATIVPSIPAVSGSRFNDVIADPLGNVLCGTMPLSHGPAHLYRLTTQGDLELIWDDLGLGNGMGFSPDATIFYHSDSNNRCIYRADFDPASGDIIHREIFFRLEDDVAVPDGMTVDAAGEIWLAVWDGRCALHISAVGEVLEQIPFPVKKVSSISFGGPAYETAYVTTAGGTNRTGDDGPLAGSRFSVELPGVRGKSDFRSRILIERT